MPSLSTTSSDHNAERQKFKIQIVSFAYKSNQLPKANLLFDVRFVDNPFWIEELRPLNGLNQKVQDFVLKQEASKQFLTALTQMLKIIVPLQSASMASKIGTPSEVDTVFTIAFGCTGGWHRSVVISCEAAKLIQDLFPKYIVEVVHREIIAKDNAVKEESKT